MASDEPACTCPMLAHPQGLTSGPGRPPDYLSPHSAPKSTCDTRRAHVTHHHLSLWLAGQKLSKTVPLRGAAPLTEALGRIASAGLHVVSTHMPGLSTTGLIVKQGPWGLLPLLCPAPTRSYVPFPPGQPSPALPRCPPALPDGVEGWPRSGATLLRLPVCPLGCAQLGAAGHVPGLWQGGQAATR